MSEILWNTLNFRSYRPLIEQMVLSELAEICKHHYDAILLSVSNKGEFTSKLRIFDLNIGDLKPVINLFYPNPSSCLLFLCLVLLTNITIIIITLPNSNTNQHTLLVRAIKLTFNTHKKK